MKQPPKSCLGILGVLVRDGAWMSTTDLLNAGVKTTCIHKRLSELIALGYVKKKDNPNFKNERLYQVAPNVRLVGEVAP